MIQVVLGQDQVQEEVLKDTELDDSTVGNVIILLRNIKMLVIEKDHTEQMQEMFDSEEQETPLKVLTGETYHSLTKENLEEMINNLN